MDVDFGELCDALSRNDPAVRLPWMRHYPKNYGRRLGDALLQNSHVDWLAIDVTHGYIDDPTSSYDESSISSILRFLSEGTSLRTVILGGRTEAYIGMCLRALVKNPQVTFLGLQTTHIPSADMTFLVVNAIAIESITLMLTPNYETKTLKTEYFRALWRNGSIHCRTDECAFHEDLTDREFHRMRLVYKRNCFLRHFMVPPTDDSSGIQLSVENTTKENFYYVRCPELNVEMWFLLCPTLFAVAQQSRRHAPTWILVALSQLSCDFGPTH